MMVSLLNLSTKSAGNNRLAIRLFGEDGSEIDMWSVVGYVDFVNGGSSAYKAGSADFSISDMATGFQTISVGSYNSRKSITTISGSTYSYSMTLNGISDFSSYGVDVNGISRPDIAGPGFTVVSSVNGYDSSTVGSTTYLCSKVASGSRTCYWGDMMGTSMSSPAVAGIIALWLEAKSDLDATDIKDVFANTSIVDSYVNQAPAKFGAGKIDAKAGIIYILNSGVNDITTKQNVAMVYPNPTDGNFTVYAQGENDGVKLSIYRRNGAQVY